MSELPQGTVAAMARAWFETGVISSSLQAAEHILQAALDQGDVMLTSDYIPRMTAATEGHGRRIERLEHDLAVLREAAQAVVDYYGTSDGGLPIRRLRQELAR